MQNFLGFFMPFLTLVKLRALEFALKYEQKKALLAVYEGKGRLCEPTKRFREEHLLSDLEQLAITHLL